MRPRTILLLVTVAALAAPAGASAYFGHVVAAGESLSSVAAADGVPVSQLAAANGLASDSQLIAGSTLQIPPQGATVSQAAPASTGVTAAAAASGDGDADSDDTASTAATGSGESALGTVSPSSTSGGYTVALGDTLSGIAARYGVSVDQLAAANGLDPAGILPAGDVLSLSGGSTATAQPVSTPVTTSAPAATSGSSGAQPTPETVSASDVGQVAAGAGVSPSLAEAIGYQESGFNNNLVSSTGATGVMQIEPGTWNYIGSNLISPPPLSPSSAQDNIRAGVTLLHSLLGQTGGDPALAAAGYYQGLESVRQHGMYADTQQYVNDVMALRQRFGGG
jgi:N-acetylmuramoyl-L-alanine amidase